MFWLVLYYTSIAVIPEKYPTEEACKKAGEQWLNRQYACIPSNGNDYCQQQIAPGSNLVITVPCSTLTGKP